MRFSVRHLTWYRYDAPVRLGPHVLRLTPRPDQGDLHRHHIELFPEPTSQRVADDAAGNRLLCVEFGDHCEELRIESSFELETRPARPMPRDLLPLPWRHAEAVATGVGVSPEVKSFADALAREVDGDAVGFLDRLAEHLHGRFDHHVRHTGDAWSAAETLARGRGACRDITLLFMDAARSQGLRSRFVSGYQAFAETIGGQRHLHAWPEAELPGAGFRAWDPTHGTRVTNDRVSLCAAATQAETMPVEGTLSTDAAALRSTLDFRLQIQASSTSAEAGIA